MSEIKYFTALEYLNCGNNQITTIDISKNTALKYLNCRNSELSAIDVSKNTALTSLDCSSNQLTTLTISSSQQNAEWLDKVHLDYVNINIIVK